MPPILLVLFNTTCDSLVYEVRDDPKLPDDSGKIPTLNGVVGGAIPGYEIISSVTKTSQVVKRLLCFQTRKRKKKKEKRKKTRLCIVTNTKCTPHIICHCLWKTIGHNRLTMLQLLSLTNWSFTQISITHLDIALQEC